MKWFIPVMALPLALVQASAFAAAPPFFVQGPILHNVYDGITDDLLTGGLGKSGLLAAPPAYANPLAPTAAELRVRAIYVNYRGGVDVTVSGGFGVFYGPNIDLAGNPTLGEGKIAGEEFTAFADNGSGKQNVTMLVQVPASFDPHNPCIVTATSPGSTGIYGGIANAGDWGLKRGCAVAYSDKGTGLGVHDLQGDTVNLITGERATAAAAGNKSNFTSDLSGAKLAAFNAATPNRFAFKHAHSRQNPESAWGTNTLNAIEFAFYVLNQKGIGSFTKSNTLVIASSLSNGGGGALRAVEQDLQGAVDGVAVLEPNVQPVFYSGFSIRQGNKPALTNHSKKLFDYYTLINLYQPCANLANPAAPFNFVSPALNGNRCTSLKEKGLLSAATLADQAAEAQAIINAYGFLPEQNILAPGHDFFSVQRAIAVTYANSYGKISVGDNLCGFSFAATDAGGNVIAAPAATVAGIFAGASGIPPTGGINLVNNLSVGGAKEDRISVSASTNRQDINIDGAICLRNLAVGKNIVTGKFLPLPDAANSLAIKNGINQLQATGFLHRLPVVIVQGRNDPVLPPNHTSRAYYGLNKTVEGSNSNLYYYEITNGQHLDGLNAFAGYSDKFVPLAPYFTQALNLMYDRLKSGKALPPSQVVHTVPRGVVGGVVPALSAANMPPISATPGANAITFSGGVLSIPE